MGDPRKARKQYQTPSHPWQAARIQEEGILTKKYGLANKREIWKMTSIVRNWRARARMIAAMLSNDRAKEEAIFVAKLQKLGVLGKDAGLDDILALEPNVLFEKRLQTTVYKMGMANTVKQARQFVVHGKVIVNGQLINSPSYLVKANDKIAFIEGFAPKVEIKKLAEESKRIKAESELIKAKEELATEELIGASKVSSELIKEVKE